MPDTFPPVEWSARLYGSFGPFGFIGLIVVLLAFWYVGAKSYNAANPPVSTVTLDWRTAPNANDLNFLDLLVTNTGRDGEFIGQCMIADTRNSSFGRRDNYTFTMNWLGVSEVNGSKTILNGTTERIRFASIESIDQNTTTGVVRIRELRGVSFLDDAWTQGINGPKPEWDIEIRISQKNAIKPLVKRYAVTIPAGGYVFHVEER